MLTSITLANFKSFGEERTIPLRPMTVLVGPNNSGKSNLVSLGRFVRNAFEADIYAAIDAEGGVSFVEYQPPLRDPLHIEWASNDGRYSTKIGFLYVQEEELLQHHDYGSAWAEKEDARRLSFGARPATSDEQTVQSDIIKSKFAFSGLKAVMVSEQVLAKPFRSILDPMVHSREVKLAIAALRQDAEVVPQPRLGGDGSNLAAVLGLWRGSDPDRVERLHDFIRRNLPEIRNVFVKPSPQPAHQRLWVQQTDGEQFDAEHLSDGVLYFIGLAMHAIDVEPGSLLFVEEPEQCIHPRRLGSIVDLFRQVVAERGCQLVVVTHSPVLLDEFRDEPEAIVLFRRGENGTEIKQLTEMPTLVQALQDAQPGEMLANGFFDAPFR